MFGGNTGGSLFGANTGASNNGGGIFGQANAFGAPSNPPQGGGLFGGGAPANNALGGGSNNMFGGNNNNNPQGGGMFGGLGANTNNSNGGGMFGAAQPAQNGGGLFGAAQQNTNTFGGGGGGLFGGNNQPANNNGGGMFGQPQQNPTQPSPFSLNGTQPNNGGGGLFGGATNQPQGNTGGIFGGAGFGGNTNNNNMMLNNNTQNTGGGIFGAMGNNNAATGMGAQNTVGIFGMNQNNNNNQGGMFGMNNTANNTGGGLFGGQQNNNNNKLLGGGLNTGGMLNNANATSGGLLGGGFNMGNNNGGLLGQTTNTFGGLGSFGTANNNMASNMGGATQYQAKPSANPSLSSKATEKNICQSVSNGQDYCITECALIQRKMIKNGQLKPGVQQQQGGMMFGQTQGGLGQPNGGGMFGQTTQQPGGLGLGVNTNTGLGGGLFGAQNQTQPATGGGLFGAQNNTAQSGGIFGAKPNTTPGVGGMFGATQPAAVGGGGLFGGNTGQQTGGLFGATQPAAQQGGLFGAPGNTGAPTTGGGLFGGQTGATAPATGGLFGGNTATTQPNGMFQNPAPLGGGGLLGGTQSNTQGGGLFGGATNLNLGGGAATNTGGLFGATTSQPTTGGLLGAAPQSGGLFGGAPAQSGGLFGAQNPAQSSGGLFGQTSGGLSAPQQGGLFQTQGQSSMGAAPLAQGNQQGISGFQSLIQLLEVSTIDNKQKSILEDDSEQHWVYGKSRDGQPGNLGYYQGDDLSNQSSVTYTISEHQSLYGYKKKKQDYNQFRAQALRDEKDKRDEYKKILSSFSSSYTSAHRQNIDSAAPKKLSEINRTSSLNSQSSQLQDSRKFIEQIDHYIDFIKSGTQNRIKIPIKPRYTFGDIKNRILNEYINDTNEDNIRNFRLQARLKGTNKVPKPLRDNEQIFNSEYVKFENIDYLELVEKFGDVSTMNNTLVNNNNNNKNNSFILNNSQNEDIQDRSYILNNSRIQNASLIQEQNNNNNNNNNQSSNRFKIPAGFTCSPSIEKLEKLTDQQLMNVEYFVIENENAKIVFEDKINLLDLDLSKLIFEDSRISLEYISQSSRLNKPCIIEFKKFGLKQLNSGKSKEEVRYLVDKLVKKKNLELIEPYDVDNTKLVYRQDSFDQI